MANGAATANNLASDTSAPRAAKRLARRDDPARVRIPKRDLAVILRNVYMLLENGLSLPRVLTTLAKERSIRRHAHVLNAIRRKIESGETFSSAVAEYPRVFSKLIVYQIRVGERSGTIVLALKRIAEQIERHVELRKTIVKKVSYPAMVFAAGTSLVIFMMLVVVPQFESMYQDSKATLPMITQLVARSSRFLARFGWVAIVVLAGGLLLLRYLRKKPNVALKMDRFLLRVPMLGQWFRDFAVLQFIDAAGVMMEAGYVPVDSIAASVSAVGNRAVRQAVKELKGAVSRGERLSRELAKYPDIFPPTVSQLVIVGEETGNLSKSTVGVREHLRGQIQNRIDAMISMIEPVLIVFLAFVIGCIVLAIYLPMFGMIDAFE